MVVVEKPGQRVIIILRLILWGPWLLTVNWPLCIDLLCAEQTFDPKVVLELPKYPKWKCFDVNVRSKISPVHEVFGP